MVKVKEGPEHSFSVESTSQSLVDNVLEKIENNDDSFIDVFTKSSVQSVCRSNLEEFIDQEVVKNEAGSARTVAPSLDIDVYIPVIKADNQEGPLGCTIISSTISSLVSPHGVANSTGGGFSERPVQFNPLEERIRNIETHLGIVIAPIDQSLAQRVQVLEEKILRIECTYPQIASHVFNYGRAEVEASSRPGGRVSRAPGAPQSSSRKKNRPNSSNNGVLKTKYVDDDIGKSGLDDIPENFGVSNEESLEELKRRMEELKQRLLSKSTK